MLLWIHQKTRRTHRDILNPPEKNILHTLEYKANILRLSGHTGNHSEHTRKHSRHTRKDSGYTRVQGGHTATLWTHQKTRRTNCDTLDTPKNKADTVRHSENTKKQGGYSGTPLIRPPMGHKNLVVLTG